MDRKPPLHIIDASSKVRAELARLGFNLGHHAEVYSGIGEIAERPPQTGIIVLRDDPGSGGIGQMIERLAGVDVWLPVLAVGDDPDTDQVVDAIKAGALQYLTLPMSADALERVLVQIEEEARAYSQARRRMVEARGRLSKLSRREREVLDWLSEGSSNKAIARELAISPRTVEIHRANMMTKLGASHPADAVRLRLEAGLGQGRKQAAIG